MKVSIALATYNGAHYLKQQLDSIQAQTHLPDELVVCDDCSEDSTVKILKEFKDTASFFVNIIQNKSNLGYTGNFEKAISFCTGELIFVCDQDDFWFRKKIETMTIYMRTHQEVFIAINDAEVVDMYLHPTGITKQQQIRNLYGDTDRFIPGCCSVFRSSWKSLFLPFPAEYEAYDGWLHYIGKTLDCRAVVKTPLQYYRIHDKNTSDFAPNSTHKLGVSDRVGYIWGRIFKNQKRLKLESLKVQIEMQRLLLDRIKVILKNSDERLFYPCTPLFVKKIEWRTSILKLRFKNIRYLSLILTGKLVIILILKGRKSGLTWKGLISDLLTR